MTPLFKKLHHKGQSPVCILNAPADLAPLWDAMAPFATLMPGLPPEGPVTYVLAFATTLADVERLTALIIPRLEGDATLWFCYPKASSKRYRCAFNRDTGWAALGAADFEPVSQVALDADWSALRFRRVGYIAKMTRGFAMTEEGKQKAGLG